MTCTVSIYLFDAFLVHSGLKHMDTFIQLLFNFAVEYFITKIPRKSVRVGIE
jgi:hypothetical protein